jgi:hypothetical protein
VNKYKLIKKKEVNKFIVTIVADSNDADYITTINKYDEVIFCKYVIDELIHLEKYSGRHELESYEDNGISEYLNIPFNGYDGYCHTLESVKVEFIDHNGHIYDVQY